MRLTQHSGRATKVGIYSDKHNDRQFDIDSAENIDCDRIKDNVYYGHTDKGVFLRYHAKNIGTDTKHGHIGTFAEQESMIYQDMFGGQYNRQMAAYKKKGNHSRITDFESWRKCKRYAPEEVCYQLGKMGDVFPDEGKRLAFYEDITQYLLDMADKNNYILLNVAIHMDETGEIHLQARRVWWYLDAGIPCIGQEKALEQAGVPLPEPKKKPGKYNNLKMTFDAKMRKKAIELAEKHGFAIEKEPMQGATHNRSKEQYLIDLATEKLAEVEARQAELDEREKELDEREKELAEAEEALQALREKTEAAYRKISAAAQARLRPVLAEIQQLDHDSIGPDY